MNINLMRHIDYWLGIPLCFLLTIMNYIHRFINFRQRKNNIVRKILFIKLSEVGSIVLAYPLLRKIKENYPQAEIFFLTFKKNKLVFEVLSIVPYQNILTIREESPHLFISDTLRSIRRLRKENKKKIDIAFDLEFFPVLLQYLLI